MTAKTSVRFVSLLTMYLFTSQTAFALSQDVTEAIDNYIVISQKLILPNQPVNDEAVLHQALTEATIMSSRAEEISKVALETTKSYIVRLQEWKKILNEKIKNAEALETFYDQPDFLNNATGG